MAQQQLFILKVALSHAKRTWRRIEILGDQSLDQLHETIFDAFDRYDPHLYSFYMTKPGSKSRRRFNEAPEYTHPSSIEDDFGWGGKKLNDATQTKISDLKLKAKTKFEYLFDFGDNWLHEITIEKILDIFPEKNYPIITVSNGESPQQYPEYDDDGGEEY